jgi:very-short-patch-repair endonuclease
MDQNGKYVTPQAKKLQEALEKQGIKIISEYYDGYKHVDLFLPEARIAIEVDGLQHVSDPKQIMTDFQREHYSKLNNIDTMHLENSVVDRHLNEIADAIAKVVKERKILMLLEKVQLQQTVDKKIFKI